MKLTDWEILQRVRQPTREGNSEARVRIVTRKRSQDAYQPRLLMTSRFDVVPYSEKEEETTH